ncbi:MAG: hypothetical protein ACTSQ4_02395 [Candidatus Heimdallarchaeaceae archaeon]
MVEIFRGSEFERAVERARSGRQIDPREEFKRAVEKARARQGRGGSGGSSGGGGTSGGGAVAPPPSGGGASISEIIQKDIEEKSIIPAAFTPPTLAPSTSRTIVSQLADRPETISDPIQAVISQVPPSRDELTRGFFETTKDVVGGFIIKGGQPDIDLFRFAGPSKGERPSTDIVSVSRKATRTDFQPEPPPSFQTFETTSPDATGTGRIASFSELHDTQIVKRGAAVSGAVDPIFQKFETQLISERDILQSRIDKEDISIEKARQILDIRQTDLQTEFQKQAGPAAQKAADFFPDIIPPGPRTSTAKGFVDLGVDLVTFSNPLTSAIGLKVEQMKGDEIIQGTREDIISGKVGVDSLSTVQEPTFKELLLTANIVGGAAFKTAAARKSFEFIGVEDILGAPTKTTGTRQVFDDAFVDTTVSQRRTGSGFATSRDIDVFKLVDDKLIRQQGSSEVLLSTRGALSDKQITLISKSTTEGEFALFPKSRRGITPTVGETTTRDQFNILSTGVDDSLRIKGEFFPTGGPPRKSGPLAGVGFRTSDDVLLGKSGKVTELQKDIIEVGPQVSVDVQQSIIFKPSSFSKIKITGGVDDGFSSVGGSGSVLKTTSQSFVKPSTGLDTFDVTSLIKPPRTKGIQTGAAGLQTGFKAPKVTSTKQTFQTDIITSGRQFGNQGLSPRSKGKSRGRGGPSPDLAPPKTGFGNLLETAPISKFGGLDLGSGAKGATALSTKTSSISASDLSSSLATSLQTRTIQSTLTTPPVGPRTTQSFGDFGFDLGSPFLFPPIGSLGGGPPRRGRRRGRKIKRIRTSPSLTGIVAGLEIGLPDPLKVGGLDIGTSPFAIRGLPRRKKKKGKKVTKTKKKKK